MRNRKGKIVGIVLVLMLAAVSFGNDEVFAANGWEIPLNTTTTTTSQTSSSVSLSISPGTVQTDLNAANASANPDEAGKVLSQTATITVGNTDGYTVYVSGNTNLTGRNDSNHKIPSITSAKTLGSMSNEWGYYGVLGDTEVNWNPSTSFKAMTADQQTVGTGEATTSNVTKTVTLFYGARVNDSIAEDFYGNTVTLSVVAQPRTVTTTVTKFNGITTMQEMTASICSAAAENDTAYLKDTRDGKYYWVTKLADKNCWMSQNLDLDITTNNITTVSSDVTTNWTASSTYPARATTTSLTTGSTTNTETYSWDLGQYVINAPTGTTSCGSNATGLSGCSMFTDVTGWTPSDDPNFYKNNNGSSVNASTKTYDAHYLVGNYYQWNAATAGTGGTITSANAAGSICPKGWKLPDSNGITKNTFAYMLQQYGLASSATSGTITGTSSVNGNTYNIALSPLFAVRAGGIYSGSMPFQASGYTSRYWSSRAYSNANYAYYFSVTSNTTPSDSYYRYIGIPLRCLIPTS